MSSTISCDKPYKYMMGALYQALSYNANAFMIYTGPPQNTLRKSVNDFCYEDFLNYSKKINFNTENIIIHAPYIINPASPVKYKREFSIKFLIEELKRANDLKVETVVLHPGNHLNYGIKMGIKNCANTLNEIFRNCPNKNNVKIALETMAGKGTEIGFELEQIYQIISLVKKEYKKRVGICLDTCHMHDAGYNLKENKIEIISKIKKLFNNKVFAIHVNDSKNIIGSKKDRHANLDKGYIGIQTIKDFIFDKYFDNVIKILETPWENGKPIYKKEISLLKN